MSSLRYFIIGFNILRIFAVEHFTVTFILVTVGTIRLRFKMAVHVGCGRKGVMNWRNANAPKKAVPAVLQLVTRTIVASARRSLAPNDYLGDLSSNMSNNTTASYRRTSEWTFRRQRVIWLLLFDIPALLPDWSPSRRRLTPCARVRSIIRGHCGLRRILSFDGRARTNTNYLNH